MKFSDYLSSTQDLIIDGLDVFCADIWSVDAVALEFVAPSNLVQVFDQLFNLTHLEELKRRYDKALDLF